MEKSEAALESFSKGITCSASVFGAFAQDLGLDKKIARKIACGFGGGEDGSCCGERRSIFGIISFRQGRIPGSFFPLHDEQMV